MPTRLFERFEIECSDEKKFQAIDKIKERAMKIYEDVNAMDGVKVVFPDSWALTRASNTSPVIRLSVEARNQKRFDELKEEMTKLINSLNIEC